MTVGRIREAKDKGKNYELLSSGHDAATAGMISALAATCGGPAQDWTCRQSITDQGGPLWSYSYLLNDELIDSRGRADINFGYVPTDALTTLQRMVRNPGTH